MRAYGLWMMVLPLLVVVGCASKDKRSSDDSAYIEGQQRTLLKERLEAVYFDFDKADLRSDARAVLDKHVKYLRDHKEVHAQVEGHCDERGTVEYNLALGERRALSVKDFLVSGGIASSRLTFISYGEERPADPGHSEASWDKNRRAEFVLYK